MMTVFRKAYWYVRRVIRAPKKLCCLIRYLNNWPSVFLAYLVRYGHAKPTDQATPPLHFRSGLVWHHGPYDDPVLLFAEIYEKQWYKIAAPPANSTMVDIGANIGAVTLFFARMYPSLSVHAYEPNPSAFEMLCRNINSNGLGERVVPFSDAVGRSFGELSLWVDVNTRLSNAFTRESPNPGGRRILVPTVALDEVWRRLN